MRISPKLEDCLREYGLFVRGVTRLTDEEIERYECNSNNAELALIGNIGSSYWTCFSQSVEFVDGTAHPLDRWSRRIAEVIARQFSLQALYPFEGPPYYPFQQWARRAEGLHQSPVGVMMHPQYGLWHSYRFALLGAQSTLQDSAIADASTDGSFNTSPCVDCDDKPCLNTCPVGAFDDKGYAVERCADYLQQTPRAECHQQGCLARYACPIAPDLSYVAAQGRFHLRAFLQSRPALSGT